MYKYSVYCRPINRKYNIHNDMDNLKYKSKYYTIEELVNVIIDGIEYIQIIRDQTIIISFAYECEVSLYELYQIYITITNTPTGDIHKLVDIESNTELQRGDSVVLDDNEYEIESISVLSGYNEDTTMLNVNYEKVNKIEGEDELEEFRERQHLFINFCSNHDKLKCTHNNNNGEFLRFEPLANNTETDEHIDKSNVSIINKCIKKIRGGINELRSRFK